jgi:hypothetical protein
LYVPAFFQKPRDPVWYEIELKQGVAAKLKQRDRKKKRRIEPDGSLTVKKPLHLSKPRIRENEPELFEKKK